ncbi:MAG: NAD(P)H-hydrate dehydratase [Clostridiales bacterium]|nr:NAD(P)H-hydrate dehydratase [Clostridiales bacterium]
MKNVLSAAQVRAAEEYAMSKGVTRTILRFSASLAVADIISEHAGAQSDKRIAVFCGSGGNGCDGLLVACRLHTTGYGVTAYTVDNVSKIDGEIMAFVNSTGLTVKSAAEYVCDADLIVDAIFGIGLNKPITGELVGLIQKLNAQKDAYRLALDVPSGLNCDTGEVMGVCFKADETVTFSCYKSGMLFGNGRDVCGKIIVKDIGILTSSDIYVYEDEDFPAYTRERTAHKGTAGKVYIMGGCGSMVGAPIMAGAAAHTAYLNGAGTVTICVPNIHRAAMSARATMAVLKFMPDTPDGFIKFDKTLLDDIIKNASAICLGVGMGANPELSRIVKYICENYDKAVVIDADAINSIKGDYSFLKTSKAKVILTPHVGEFKRLTDLDATVENAVKIASELNILLVLKSATTIITDGKQVRLNVTGTPAMAKGGMGDMLGGCITSLTCAYDPIDAATIACYRNGLGAERAVSSYAQMMLTASDVLKFADYKE